AALWHAARVPLHPNVSRRSAHPSFGVSEAKEINPRAKARRERRGIVQDGGMLNGVIRETLSSRVMRGLDPRIHLLRKRSLRRTMDCRVKPGNDSGVIPLAVSRPAMACSFPRFARSRSATRSCRKSRRRNFIVVGLLFTMKAATHTCRAGEGPTCHPRCVTIRDIPYVTIRVIMRLDLKLPCHPAASI